ncbi:TPA: AAA family ATPase, partial [Escherichia coli]|nr:AAA family ATPase [Escherichia coli]
MDKQRASQVFVPGGMPKLTYVERSEGEVHGKLESAKDNLCKLVTLTGQTKSGKTVITRMVFPVMDDDVVWIDGGSITTEDDIWEQVLEKLNGYHSIEVNSGENSAIAVSGKVSGTASAFVVKGTGEAGLVQTDGKSNGNKKSRTISAKSSALKVLSQTKSSLIIDDFHYLDRDLQGNFIRAIKPLVFDGVPVVLIAIPHRRYDAVKVEKEITGRLENIS